MFFIKFVFLQSVLQGSNFYCQVENERNSGKTNCLSRKSELLTSTLVVTSLPSSVVCSFLFSVFLRDFYAKWL